MAEAFGAAASGAGLIALAIQLAETAVKLKRFYDTCKNAPQTLIDTAEDIEIFSQLLRQIERDRMEHSEHDAELVQRCVGICRRGTDRIVRTTDKLEAYLRRSKVIGRMYVALKEEELHGLCDELERSKSSLALAYQLYVDSMRRGESAQLRHALASYHEVVDLAILTPITLASPPHSRTESHSDGQQDETAGCLSTSTTTTPKSTTEQTSPDFPSGRPASILKNRRKAPPYIHIRLAPWFTHRVWEVTIINAQSGWDVNIRTFNDVPWSPIFTNCVLGNVGRVQRLITDGKASPFDRTMSDQTTLEIAAEEGHVHLCHVLMSYGRFPNQHDVLLRAFKQMARYTDLSSYSEDVASSMYRLFCETPELDFDDILSLPRRISFPSCTSILQQSAIEPWEMVPLEQRLEFAMRLDPWYCRAAEFLAACGYSEVDHELATAVSTSKKTLLTYIVNRLYAVSSNRHWGTDSTEWVDLLLDVVRSGADLLPQALDAWPLRRILRCVAHSYWHGFDKLRAGYGTELIRQWAQRLQEAGVDLVKYGKAETARWREETSETFTKGVKGIDFVGVRFGSSPEGWDYVVRHTRIVQKHSLAIVPGSYGRRVALPETITWKPEEQDIHSDDELWRPLDQNVCLGTRVLSESLRQQPIRDAESDFAALIGRRAEDDTSTIMRLLSRRPSHPNNHRRRSCSQPPLMSAYHRKLTAISSTVEPHWEGRTAMTSIQTPSQTHSWLPPYHFCLREMRYTLLDCRTAVHEEYLDQWCPSPRACMHGECLTSVPEDFAQQRTKALKGLKHYDDWLARGRAHEQELQEAEEAVDGASDDRSLVVNADDVPDDGLLIVNVQG